MKQVLWISRHRMTPEQLEDLEAVLQDSVTLIPWTDTVQEVEELLPLVAQSDAVAAVLPTVTVPPFTVTSLGNGSEAVQVTSPDIVMPIWSRRAAV